MDAGERETPGALIKTDPRCAACVRSEAVVAGKAVGGRAGVGASTEAQGIVDRGLSPDRTPSVWLTEVHRIAAKAAGAGKAPFDAARTVIRNAAVGLVQHAEREIAGASDARARFAIASRWAAAATHLDPRSAGLGSELPKPEVLAEAVIRIASGPLAVDDSEIAFELLKKSRNVLFVHDGIGELSLDRLLVDEILKTAKRVYSAVSAQPLGGRATLDDLHRVGLADIVTEIFPVGAGEIGVVWEEASRDFKGKLEVVDLIVSKGQANVYALHDREKEILKPMYCLFRTQCDPIAEAFGQKGRVTVLKVWK